MGRLLRLSDNYLCLATAGLFCGGKLIIELYLLRMKRKNAEPLSNLMSDFFTYRLDLKMQLAKYRALKGWHEILGEGVSQYSKNLYFNRDILHVHLSSAVLRAELLMNKDKLIEKINEYAGMPVVRDIMLS